MANIGISELFGPTIQGEGVDVGRPCLFIRLQNCPVHCPGCDTYYTWDGSEKPKYNGIEKIKAWYKEEITKAPGCGVVVSGGEPLLHYNNDDFMAFLNSIKNTNWLSVETSGFTGPKRIILKSQEDSEALCRFVNVWSTVHCSPKVTPCLHGKWTDEELLVNILDMMAFREDKKTLVFKLVCRDEADIEVVCKLNDKFKWQKNGHPIYLMPYGNNPKEILEQCDKLVPYLAKYGFALSPRLHSIIWGNVRER